MLLETPEALADPAFLEETPQVIANGISHKSVCHPLPPFWIHLTILLQPFISDNCVLAAGKFLLSDKITKGFETTKNVLEALAVAIKAPASGSSDTKRLALVVVRTVSREHSEVYNPSCYHCCLLPYVKDSNHHITADATTPLLPRARRLLLRPRHGDTRQAFR